MVMCRFGTNWMALALVLGGLAIAATGRAQPSDEGEARRLFEAGRSAYAEGDYEGAHADFQRSYELSHRPVLLYNIGMALDRLRRDEEAIAAYEQYLRAIPAAENRAFVEQRLVILRQSQAKGREAARSAPTPEQTARAQLESEHSAAPPAPDQPSGRPVYRKWWFWTSIGAVVAAGVVAGIVATRPTSKHSEGPLLDGPGTQVVRL